MENIIVMFKGTYRAFEVYNHFNYFSIILNLVHTYVNKDTRKYKNKRKPPDVPPFSFLLNYLFIHFQEILKWCIIYAKRTAGHSKQLV